MKLNLDVERSLIRLDETGISHQPPFITKDGTNQYDEYGCYSSINFSNDYQAATTGSIQTRATRICDYTTITTERTPNSERSNKQLTSTNTTSINGIATNPPTTTTSLIHDTHGHGANDGITSKLSSIRSSRF